MNVRRVRLLPEKLEAHVLPAALEVPRARRVKGSLDRLRVRSVWLRAEDGDPRAAWGWRRSSDGEPKQQGSIRPAAVRAPETLPDDFLPRLRELLRPDVRAILKREEWPEPLYPFQEEGALFLYEREGALLADEMGLGKTVQALAAAGLLLSTGEIAQALVLCPAPLVSHWTREARRWLPRIADAVTPVTGVGLGRHYAWYSRSPVLICSQETFRQDFTAGRLPDRPIDLVILDEAQRIKNDDTGLAHACKALHRGRSWALTGTPLENRLEDLLSILEWITGGTAIGLSARARLREAQQQLQLRRKKEGVGLELPPKSIIDVLLELGPRQAESYRRLEAEGRMELQERGESLEVSHVLAVLTRLKQVCNFCPSTGESAKLEYLRPQLAELLANGRQALVFSQFTDDSAGIRRVAAEAGAPVDLYHGGMSHPARDEAVRRFNAGESRILALSLRAGGVGLNLQQASYVFHFDRWWNPAAERQAEDRAHRLGQRLPVTVYRLIVAGTIEERVHAVLEAKQKLFEEIVEGAPAPGRARLTLDDLFGVLDLPVPTRLKERAEATDEDGTGSPDAAEDAG
jgi:SNF2 family DNA or RNA helicase